MGDFLYLCDMEKVFVYIARIVDHGGKFVNGYHKIGKTNQYKIRETQLNSTHLPFDVLMIRVFECDNMGITEGILHTCFADYRVVKEYDDRRNITTEWFDVSDIDVFKERVDKIVNLMSLTEVQLIKSIENDKTLNESEKNKIKDQICDGSNSTLRIIFNDEVFYDKVSKNNYVNVINKITRDINTDELLFKFPSYFKITKEEFAESLQDSNKVLLENGLYFSTWGSNKTKMRRIINIREVLDINNLTVEII